MGAMALLIMMPTEARAQSPESGKASPKGGPAGIWSLTLRLNQSWDSNVRFVAVEPESVFMNRLGAGLSRTWRGERGQLLISADGEGSVYHGASDLNRINYGGSLSGSHRASSRLEMSVVGGFSSAYGRDASVLVESGLLLPTTVIHTTTAGAGLAYRVSPGSTLTGRADFSRVDFREGDLQDGSSLAATTTWSRALGSQDTLSLSHVYQHTTSGDQTGRTHTLTAGWQRVLGRRLRFGGSVGVLRMSSENAAAKIRPQGGASLSARFRKSNVSAQYGRTVSQAFGFGRDRLADLVSANYELEATRRLRLQASWSLSRSRDPFDPEFRLDATTGTAGWALEVARGLSLEGGYAFRRNAGSLPIAKSHAVSVSVTYRRGGQDRKKPGDGEPK